MDINIHIDNANYKKQTEKFIILGNTNHLRILLILEDVKKPMRTEELRKILEKEGIYKHRENTHKALQKLVRVGLVKKSKGENKIGDIYFL